MYGKGLWFGVVENQSPCPCIIALSSCLFHLVDMLVLALTLTRLQSREEDSRMQRCDQSTGDENSNTIKNVEEPWLFPDIFLNIGDCLKDTKASSLARSRNKQCRLPGPTYR